MKQHTLLKRAEFSINIESTNESWNLIPLRAILGFLSNLQSTGNGTLVVNNLFFGSTFLRFQGFLVEPEVFVRFKVGIYFDIKVDRPGDLSLRPCGLLVVQGSLPSSAASGEAWGWFFLV